MTTALTVHRALAENQPLRTARIPLLKLRMHPRNVRLDLGDLATLADSLTHDGQHQPLKVQRRGDYFQIIDGHRRFGAAVIAGLRSLQAVIVPDCTDAEALAAMLTTGLHSRPLSATERHRAVRALIDEEHMPTADVAARCGVTAATIRRWYHDPDPDPDAGAVPAPTPAHDPHEGPPRRGQRPRPRRRTVVAVRVLSEVIDRWMARCTTDAGLPAEQAVALLAELRALAGPATDTTADPDDARGPNEHPRPDQH